MSSRIQRRRRTLGIECLEGRLALSGGLAAIAHVEHARGNHAEIEMHKGEAGAHQSAATTVSTASHRADDPANHDVNDVNDDKGAHHGGGKEHGPGHE